MANIKNGIVGYLEGVRGLPGKDGNPGVWIGPEPPESSEYEVWVNPTGNPFTAEWENVEDKPFETLSSDFNVDSEGSLHVVGGTGGASDWEDLENKPFETIGNGLSVNNGALDVDPIDYSDIQNTPTIPSATSDLDNDSGFITSSDIPDWDTLEDKPFESIGEGLSVSSIGVISADNQLPSYVSGDAGKMLTINNSGTGIEWSTRIIALTQAQYDQITPDANTYYFIYEV